MTISYNDLEPKQQKAFELATSGREGVIRIVGYAGTGKTTVMAAAAKELGSSCYVLAPTNKAALNLKMKGIPSAQTIHSCLYMPHEVAEYERDKSGNVIYHLGGDGNPLVDKDGAPIPKVIARKMAFGLRQEAEDGLPPIVLVDEASMVDEEILDDLLKCFECVVLFGDGFQLPPVGRNRKSSLDIAEADVFLDEIHRVAAENPIIRYVTDIRNGNEPDIMEVANKNEICVCSKTNKALYETMVEKDVQAISYRNRTRHSINELIREAKGFAPNTIVSGDMLVCNANVRVFEKGKYGVPEKVLRYFNGQILTSASSLENTSDHFIAEMIELIDESGKREYQKIWPFWNQGFFELKEENKREWFDEVDRRKAGHGRISFGADFDYAYCLTAHKAQGSEFKNVAVFDERKSVKHISRKDKQRWYYTAVTRAKERVLIVL